MQTSTRCRWGQYGSDADTHARTCQCIRPSACLTLSRHRSGGWTPSLGHRVPCTRCRSHWPVEGPRTGALRAGQGARSRSWLRIKGVEGGAWSSSGRALIAGSGRVKDGEGVHGGHVRVSGNLNPIVPGVGQVHLCSYALMLRPTTTTVPRLTPMLPIWAPSCSGRKLCGPCCSRT